MDFIDLKAQQKRIRGKIEKRIQSVLTLEEPANTTYRFSAGSAAKIPLSGYLIADGNPVNGATISFFDNGSELTVKTRTDSNGYFSFF